jgi:two-component system cell cycle sensor histidine kinase/response regulator CckA
MPELTVLEIRSNQAIGIQWSPDVVVWSADGLLSVGEVLSQEPVDVLLLHAGCVEAETLLKMTPLPVVLCAEDLSASAVIALFRQGVRNVVPPTEAEAACLAFQNMDLDPLDALLSDEGSWLLHADLIEREKLATLGELATGMAHSINNPGAWVVTNLNEMQISVTELKALLQAALSLAKEYAPADRVAELASHAKAAYYPQNLVDMHDMIAESLEGMRRIRDIVGDLKGFQRADEDEWMPTHVGKALSTAVEMARSQMIVPVHIEVTLTDTPPVNASPGRLAQALLNILLNAIQAYGRQPGEECQVRVSCLTVSGSVCVRVEDQGVGIPEDQLSRVFDPFFTLHEKKGQSGLGLAIARDIVHRHGGEIQVQSQQGQGTQVEVQLPVPAEFRQEPKPQAEDNSSLDLPRILLVDDEPPMTRAIRRVLKGLGEITVAHTAQEALEQIESRPPHLVICDLHLPDRSGMALFREVSQKTPELGGAFLFLTGGAKDKEGELFLEKYRDRVVEKPFESPALRARVAALLK